ncbi:MAG TPA: hypothetical protein VJ743_10420, partial [Albitalea sp.]|nr:hypothetical protein [Albitalea sp.]
KLNGAKAESIDRATGVVSDEVMDNGPKFQSTENSRPRTIEPQQTDTINNDLADLADIPLAHADIGLRVYYRVWYLPWQYSALYRFETQRAVDGHLFWVPKSKVETHT